ncbi:hypothetical protein CF326_g118, partial [Tilletia indica]
MNQRRNLGASSTEDTALQFGSLTPRSHSPNPQGQGGSSSSSSSTGGGGSGHIGSASSSSAQAHLLSAASTAPTHIHYETSSDNGADDSRVPTLPTHSPPSHSSARSMYPT